VTYEDGAEMKIARPDFVFFSEQTDGTVIADIIDPHGIHFADALPKLRGLAQYADTNSGIYRRIAAVAELNNGFRILDLTKLATRAAVFAATTAKTLYESNAAAAYPM
jgi:type III restriction enzyme